MKMKENFHKLIDEIKECVVNELNPIKLTNENPHGSNRDNSKV
jgi:hypothetical protein